MASKYIDTKQTNNDYSDNTNIIKNTSFGTTCQLLTAQNESAKPSHDFLDRKFKNKATKIKNNITSSSYDFNGSLENVQKNKLEDYFNKSSKNKLLFRLNNSIESQLIFNRIDKTNKFSSSNEKQIK